MNGVIARLGNVSGSGWRTYGLAVALTILAFAVKIAVPVLGMGVPFLVWSLMIGVSGFYGGFGPAFLSVAISSVLTYEFFIPPNTAPSTIEIVIFLGEGLILATLAGSRRYVYRGLRSAHTEAQAMQTLISDPIVTITLDSVITYANPAFGMTFLCENPVGMRMTDFMPERLRAAHTAGFERYVQTRTKTIRWNSVNVIGLRTDGQEINVSVSFVEIESSYPPRFTGIIKWTGTP